MPATERWSHEMQRREDQTVSNLLYAIADAFPNGRVDPARWEDENGRGPGCVNGRKALGKILRAAIKNGVVSVTPEQAMSLAHSGSAGHTDTAATLLAASGVHLDSEIFENKTRVEVHPGFGYTHAPFKGTVRGVFSIDVPLIYYYIEPDPPGDGSKFEFEPHVPIDGRRLVRIDNPA